MTFPSPLCAKNLLKEPAIPIIIPPQHRRDIMPAHKQTLHPPIDPMTTLAPARIPTALRRRTNCCPGSNTGRDTRRPTLPRRTPAPRRVVL